VSLVGAFDDGAPTQECRRRGQREWKSEPSSCDGRVP